MRILFISNVPSPYNVAYLNELGKLADVTAVFEIGSSSERDESWKEFHAKHFRCVVLKGLRLGTDMAFSPRVHRYLKEFKNDKIIIGNPATPTGIYALLYCKAHKIPHILQSEGGFQGSGKGLKEKCKHFLMKDAVLYLSGMTIENEYFLMYGATPERVKQYPFTSFYQADMRAAIVSESERTALREKLQIAEKTVFVSVGQFVNRKGFDVLLEAYKGFDEDVGLYMIGGEPPKEYVEFVEENHIHSAHFLPFMDKEALKEYYAAADVFVLATREDTWGLVINEAMSMALPIITTNRCIAGLSLIKDGENGYIVPVNDVDALREKMVYLAENPALRAHMAQTNIKEIAGYTLENMAQTIYQALVEYDNEKEEKRAKAE